MAYAQWAKILIKSKSVDLAIRNVDLKFGKFYENDNKEHEIKITPNQMIPIPKNNGGLWLCTCGRSDSPSGTEGSFDVYTGDGKVKIGHYYWECPWGEKRNTSIWTLADDNFTGGASGGCLDSGALGDITISIGRS
jgi:hypothetical protein